MESPTALRVLGSDHGGDVVPAAIEAHMAGDALVIVQAGHHIVNSVTVGPGFLDGGDEHMRGIIAVGSIGLGLQSVSRLETLDEIRPGFVRFVRVKKVGSSSPSAAGPAALTNSGSTMRSKPKKAALTPAARNCIAAAPSSAGLPQKTTA